MLDAFAVFNRGGALLWTLQFTALRHNPLEALNALIRTCLLEERSGDNTYTYTPKVGAAQSLKWTFHNGLGLIFVAVYQKALSLLYVDDLLAAVKQEFVTSHYAANCYQYPGFNEPFNRLLREAEQRAQDAKRAGPTVTAHTGANKALPSKQQKGSSAASAGKAVGKNGKVANGSLAGGSEEDGDDDGTAAVRVVGKQNGVSKGAAAGGANGAAAGHSDEGATGDSTGEDEERPSGGAFDLSKLKGSGPRAMRGRGGLPPRAANSSEKKKDNRKDEEAPKKKDRKWGVPKGSNNLDASKLDFSADHSEFTAGSESDVTGAYYSETDGGGPAALGASRMDVEDEEVDLLESISEDEFAGAHGNAKGQSAPAKRGLLGSFMSNLAMRVVGKQALTAEDLAPALQDMKRKLMERNVAEEIAQNICDSVARSLEGKPLASFTGVGAFVARAFEEALSGILNKRTVDMLLDIRKAQERGRPYVVVFCGVNGVGKSTNLAKIAYWLGQHNIKVLIAACDTFRAGAVEQLKTHCARLKVPLYERGYEKDPAKVAAEAIKQAEREGRHVVLVDTAGRMQDNEPLMRALSSLINVNSPNLVLFVGEALVGNDAVDQLVKFNRALHDLAPPTAVKRHVIDGIVLTKFDTIDDKVGAAVSMVYASGAPIMFLGCGQTYADLKRLNVRSVVNSLLK